jgi:VWFA-related protein
MQRNWARAFILAGLLVAGVGVSVQRFVAQEPVATGPTSRAQQTPERPANIQAVSEEVMLDMVARDKRGRPIRDLAPDQVEVFEDGVKQQITSFRLVNGEAATVAAPQTGRAATAHPEAVLDEYNLVSLVFERLGTEGRIHAREAAMAFLKSELRRNVYVAVFTNDKTLYVLQQFTNDRQRLEQTVNTATTASANQMAAQSATVIQELQDATEHMEDANQAAGQATAGMSGSRGAGAGGLGAAMAEAKMAQMTVEMIANAALMARTQEGRTSLYSLLSLVKEQRRLPGRKTIIYFSEGLNVTPALVELFKTTVSAANLSNVSVYCVDARGLVLSAVSGASHDLLLGAEGGSREGAQPGRGNGSWGSDTIGGESQGEILARANVQDTLADLSRSTGGFLVANTNEMGLAMGRIAEDIRSYYEVTYKPSTHEYDNKYHKITVKILRSGIILQTRDGYVAAPLVGGAPVFAYEAPMLVALKSHEIMEKVDYHAQALHFAYTPDGLQCHFVMEVPIADFDFKTDAGKNTSHAHFSVMAVVEDVDGKQLFKFSQDYPLEGPPEKMEVLKKGTIVFARDFHLPTGHYTVETMAFDQDTQKSSVFRSALIVPPPPQGVALSSLSIIRRLDPVPASDQDDADPLRLQNSEIVPNLGEPIHQTNGVPIYFVVYPSVQIADKPQAEIELSWGGKVIAVAPVQLPMPDSTGSIRYVATIPAAKFQPGRYQIRAFVRQGTATAEEYAFFSIM